MLRIELCRPVVPASNPERECLRVYESQELLSFAFDEMTRGIILQSNVS